MMRVIVFLAAMVAGSMAFAERFDVNDCPQPGVLDIQPDGTITGCYVEAPPPPVDRDTDSDRDGVPDDGDDCPNEAGAASNSGCPEPPATSGACPTGPNLHGRTIPANGNRHFTDCGHEDGLRAPRPTNLNHALNGRISGWSTCITADVTFPRWQFPGGDVRVGNSDQAYHNASHVPGDLIFTGSNIIWEDVRNGSVGGQVICQGCVNVEYNGTCLNPR